MSFTSIRKIGISLFLLVLCAGPSLFSWSSRKFVAAAPPQGRQVGEVALLQSGAESHRNRLAFFQGMLSDLANPVWRQLGPGIQVMVAGSNRDMQVTWWVSPQADLSNLEFNFPEVERVETVTDREWVLHKRYQVVRISEVKIRQRLADREVELGGGLLLKNPKQVGFWTAGTDVNQRWKSRRGSSCRR